MAQERLIRDRESYTPAADEHASTRTCNGTGEFLHFLNGELTRLAATLQTDTSIEHLALLKEVSIAIRNARDLRESTIEALRRPRFIGNVDPRRMLKERVGKFDGEPHRDHLIEIFELLDMVSETIPSGGATKLEEARQQLHKRLGGYDERRVLSITPTSTAA